METTLSVFVTGSTDGHPCPSPSFICAPASEWDRVVDFILKFRDSHTGHVMAEAGEHSLDTAPLEAFAYGDRLDVTELLTALEHRSETREVLVVCGRQAATALQGVVRCECCGTENPRAFWLQNATDMCANCLMDEAKERDRDAALSPFAEYNAQRPA